MAKSVTHLYEQFKPEHYELSIHPNKQKMSFSGTVTITGKKSGAPSQRLTFHQRDLKVTKAWVTKHDKHGDTEISINRLNTHNRLTEVRLHAEQMLYPGNYSVKLEFSGKITDQMNGLYPSHFEYLGKRKVILATQFESHYAREVFPCIDEPEAKATFQLTLTTQEHEAVLSNTAIEKQTKAKNELVTTFEVTPRMSTYLLAFVIGDMHSVEAKTKDGIMVRSWCSVARPVSDLQYSVDEGVRVLEFFTDYFGIPYPLEKCDQVALPDFDAGAMENWGLITYREIALLADPKNRSVSNEQYVSLVVAHELSHQWFGNLVTMKWWDDLWLNESFASLMEFIALDHIHPAWEVWEMHTSTDVVSTSSRDVYSDIQPVGVQVTDPDLIDSLFDPGIVYAKGGRLLKMLREYIGDKAFVHGLRAYFEKHAYSNASREDLWHALSEASGKNISALMTPWLEQPGMPVLHVTQEGSKLHINQERFMLDKQPDGTLWPVPLLADKDITPEIVDANNTAIVLKDSDFRIINAHASGHYLVEYINPSHREYLAELFEQTNLPSEARISRLNDIFMLSRRGEASLREGLDLLAKASHEPRDSVWDLMLRIIAASMQLTEADEEADELLKRFRRELAKDWYHKLTWDHGSDHDPNIRQLRHTVIALMTSGEDSDAVLEAQMRYQLAKEVKDIDAELRNTILGSVVRQALPGVIDQLLASYPTASAEVQLDITGALAATRDPAVAKAILHKALGPKGFVRSQDTLRWIAMFLRNHYIRDVAWDFLVNQWDWLEQTLGTSKNFDFLPVYCAAVLNTPEGLHKFKQLFDDKKHLKVLQHNIRVGLADITARIEWRQREESGIKAWLEGWNATLPKD